MASQARLEMALCATDVVHWCNHWCWTFDPREAADGPGSLLPFDLFARQAEFLRWLAGRERTRTDGLVEKSRDVGATWLCVAFAVHGWLFRPGYTVGFGSRKVDFVDKLGDADSILEKARILVDNLPEWMRPIGYSRDEHAGHCKIVNPENGSTVTGEGGDQIGRGGRKAIFFIDESAFVEHPQLIDRSLIGNTNVRIDVSTPNGPGNPFAQKRFSGAVAVFTLSWRDDPRKGEDWYAHICATKDPVTVAQEYDIDYSASIEGTAIPAAWVRAAVGLDLPESGPLVAGYDVTEGGPDEDALVKRRGPVVRMPVCWGGLNTTQSAWRVRDEAADVEVLYYDGNGPGASVRGTWDAAGGRESGAVAFTPVAVLANATPTTTRWPDELTSQEKFRDLKAELWWLVRARFEKTYEYVVEGISHPPDELISIPNDPTLIAQLSQPLAERTETGKTAIESKKKLRARGIKSPDRADALVLAFYPDAPVEWKVHALHLGAPAGVAQAAQFGRLSPPDRARSPESGQQAAPQFTTPLLSDCPEETEMDELLYPELMKKAPNALGFQVKFTLPTGEVVHGDAYPTVSQAAYASLYTHRYLSGRPHPLEESVRPRLKLAVRSPFDLRDPDADAVRKHVEARVEQWARQNRREKYEPRPGEVAQAPTQDTPPPAPPAAPPAPVQPPVQQHHDKRPQAAGRR